MQKISEVKYIDLDPCVTETRFHISKHRPRSSKSKCEIQQFLSTITI